jgi:hypothetical protein
MQFKSEGNCQTELSALIFSTAGSLRRVPVDQPEQGRVCSDRAGFGRQSRHPRSTIYRNSQRESRRGVHWKPRSRLVR